MKKKGFTLIELLATIVVLSVIALIAVPIVINVIEKVKKSALESSVKGLVESANIYYTNQILKEDITDDVIFDFEEGIQTSINKLSFKGKVYNGKLILTSDSDVITCIDDGKYYAYKEKNSDEVISGIGTCLYDGTTGDFTIESDIDVIQKECASDKEELQNQIDELTNNVNSLETLINEKEYAISELNSKIEGLNNELITLRGEKEDLENQLASSNTSNSELQNEINELNGTIATLESSIEAKNNEIKTLNGEKKTLQEQLTTKTNELATLNENLGKVTAVESDVLKGKTILTSSGLVTGTMTNNGSINQSLNAGGSYTIPKGYHDGTGKVTANTLASQTSATAAASNILSGKTAWVNGSKITGTMPNNASKTVTATTVTESGDNTLITIPQAGYYDTNSKISISNSNLGDSLDSITGLTNVASNQNTSSNSFTITFTNAVVNNYYRLVIGSNDDCSLSTTSGFNVILNNDIKSLRGNRIYVLIIKATSTTISATITTSHTTSINSGSIDHINF